MTEPEVSLRNEEFEEVKINLLQTWGDLITVDEENDNRNISIAAHVKCAKNHVDYLYCLVTGEHLYG